MSSSCCTFCKNKTNALFCDSYHLSNNILDIARLYYCSMCVDAAKAKYVDELVKVKMIPTANPLFSEKMKVKVRRSNGTLSEGVLHAGYNLGFSQTKNEVTVWILLTETMQMKPLLLSLLFTENPELLQLSEFKDGLQVKFDCETIFKTNHPEFYDKVAKSIALLNQIYFPTNTN